MTRADTPRLRVLLLAGYSRSGSTLLARILESVPGFASPGELRHLWARGLVEDRRCACGTPFSSCAFWTHVRQRAFGSTVLPPPQVRSLLADQRHVDRLFRIPQLERARANRGQGGSFEAALSRHRRCLTRVLGAVRDETGAQVVVDASKDVSHGFVLATADEVDLTVVHLVRDSRAVVNSWRRRKHDPATGRDMRRQAAARSAFEWALTNLAGERLRRVSPTLLRVRYEDLAADPHGMVRTVAAAAGLPDAPVPVGADGTLDLGDTHALSGNPLLFRRGPTRIRPDAGWHDELPAPVQALTTTMTAPALRRYGYLTS